MLIQEEKIKGQVRDAWQVEGQGDEAEREQFTKMLLAGPSSAPAVDKAGKKERFLPGLEHVYSHGLEEVYRLEDVDVGSIRKISMQSLALEQKNAPSYIMYTLDIGERFRGWLNSYVLEEPIQVLELTPQAENAFLARRVFTLQEALSADKFSGMGSGHLEEMRTKLSVYLEGKSLYRLPTFSIASLLRSKAPSESRKRWYLALLPYGLHECLYMTKMERAQLLQKSQEGGVLTNDEQQELCAEWGKILSTFLFPWVEKRGGLAQEEELLERLERVAEEPHLVRRMVALLGEKAFSPLLLLREGVFVTGEGVKRRYERLQHAFATYFYSDEIEYEMGEIFAYVQKELSLTWEEEPFSFMEKAVSLDYDLRRGKDGKLRVGVRIWEKR